MKNMILLKELLAHLADDIREKLTASLSDYNGDTQVKRTRQSNMPQKTENERQIRMYISTRDMDRDNEILMPDGVDLEDFEMSPVILESHDYQTLPIGKAVKVGIDEKGVWAVIEFAPTEDGDKALALSQFMPLTASVGFIPTDTISKSHADWVDTLKQLAKEWPEFKKARDAVVRIIRKWKLLEASIVSVPSNIHALQQEVSKQLENGKISREYAETVCKMFPIDWSKSKGDKGDKPVEKEEKPVEKKPVEDPKPKAIEAEKVHIIKAERYVPPELVEPAERAELTPVEKGIAKLSGKV